MRLAVTGAGGFVGSHLVAESERRRISVRSLVRHARPGRVNDVAVGDIGAFPNWAVAVEGCDVVVHAAARVHQMNDRASDPLAAYRRINTDATVSLARACATAGVRRLIFLSSIKVNGEATAPGRRFRGDDQAAPTDPYGISKWEAERALRGIAEDTGLEVAVVRSPLVYGPGVGANIERMMRWLVRDLPLPLGAVDNRRSMIGIDNLCDLLLAVGLQPGANGATLLAADDDDVSTTRLLRILRRALGSRSMLVPVPQALLTGLCIATGKRSIATRLLGNLQIDVKPTRALLEWTPIRTLEQGLQGMAAVFAGHAR